MKPQDFDVSELSRKLGGSNNRFRILTPDLDQETVVFKGTFRYLRLREGLSLHTSDVVETRDIVSQSQQDPGMSFVFFSKGEADARFGERTFHFGAPQKAGRTAEAVVINRKEIDGFSRRTRAGASVRKMSISISAQWLENDGLTALASVAGLKPFLRQHLAARQFFPSPSLRALIEDVMAPPAAPGPLFRLFQESRAIQIVVEMLNGIAGNDPAGTGPSLNAVEQRRLARAEDYLEAHLLDPVSIEDIAHHTGVSASSLQRLFHAAKGCSVFEYVRQRKMETALQALQQGHVSVAQAAYLAGYTNPANFSTAFRRLFGMTPRQARDG